MCRFMLVSAHVMVNFLCALWLVVWFNVQNYWNSVRNQWFVWRSISTPIHTVSSLVVVDSPGFQNPASCGQQGGATFEDLCHNYLQERLQLLFHHTTLVVPRDRYAQVCVGIVFTVWDMVLKSVSTDSWGDGLA